MSSANYREWVEHSALDRMLEHVLPIRFAEVVEWEVLLGNVSRVEQGCHKNVITRPASLLEPEGIYEVEPCRALSGIDRRLHLADGGPQVTSYDCGGVTGHSEIIS